MSRYVEFDESTSWYSLPMPTLTPDHPILEDEASETETIGAAEEEDFGTLYESPISFQFTGSNERLSRND